MWNVYLPTETQCKTSVYLSCLMTVPGTLCRRLGIAIRSSEGDVISVQKALTAGLFMNAVQLSETTADLHNPSSSGINVYKMLHSSGPGEWPL